MMCTLCHLGLLGYLALIWPGSSGSLPNRFSFLNFLSVDHAARWIPKGLRFHLGCAVCLAGTHTTDRSRLRVVWRRQQVEKIKNDKERARNKMAIEKQRKRTQKLLVSVPGYTFHWVIVCPATIGKVFIHILCDNHKLLFIFAKFSFLNGLSFSFSSFLFIIIIYFIYLFFWYPSFIVCDLDSLPDGGHCSIRNLFLSYLGSARLELNKAVGRLMATNEVDMSKD